MSGMSVNNAGGVNAAGGVGGEVDLQTLMMSVMSTRAELLEGQVRDQADKIRANNNSLKELNLAMSAANQKTESGGKPSQVKVTAMDLSASPPVNREMPIKQFMDQRGIKYPSDGDDNFGKEEWNIVVTNIKNSADSLSSTSQMDMTQLQSTMNKYNQSFEMLSNFVSKYSQSLNSIIGNMR